MSREQISVLVSDTHLSRFSEIAAACRKLGMKIERELASTGVLTGSIASENRGALHGVDGVEAVETSRKVEIPPPDAGVQ